MKDVHQPSNTSYELDPLLLAEDDWDSDSDAKVISLLEENARLRALVVQLSDLVLKHIAEQK